MAQLTDIPNELLSSMFSCLTPADLACVCLVSQQLQIVAESILYREVCLSTLRTTLPLIEIFLHAIVSRPVLGNYVRVLTIQWHDDYPDFTPPASPKPLPVQLQSTDLFTSAISSLELDFHLHTRGDHITLLLQLLPRLEYLDLAPPGDLDVLDINRYHHDSHPTILRSLRHVQCYWADGYAAIKHSSLISLLTLPSMRTLDVRLNTDLRLPYLDGTHPAAAGTSSVTDLRLSHGKITADSLSTILAVPAALSRLSYTHFPVDSNFDGPDLGRALSRSVSATLQHLELSWGEDTDWGIGHLADDYRMDFAIGSLRSWPLLESVKCPLTVLLGRGRGEEPVLCLAEVLPRVVREFEVVLDADWSVEEISEEVWRLVEAKRAGEVRSLRVVTVPRQAGKAVEWMKGECEAVGVQLVTSTWW